MNILVKSINFSRNFKQNKCKLVSEKKKLIWTGNVDMMKFVKNMNKRYKYLKRIKNI